MCVHIFKNKHKYSLNKDIQNAHTRQKNDIHVSFSRLTITNKSPNYLGLKMFNNLPYDLKQNNINLYQFKKRIKLYLVHKCSLFVVRVSYIGCVIIAINSIFFHFN